MRKYNEAINLALQVIGEQIIENDVSIEGIYEAEQADLLIENVKEELLSEGWTFNTDEAWSLAPDVEGYITVPADVIRVDTASNYIRKDGKLYDKDNQTYKFTSAVSCDIVWDLDFDVLPPIMQQYITLKASRILHQRLVGDADVLSILVQDERDALVRVKMHEEDIGDYNIFDNTTVSRVISRTVNPVGVRG